MALVREIFDRRFIRAQRVARVDDFSQVRAHGARVRPSAHDSAKNARRFSSAHAIRRRDPTQIAFDCHFILPRRIENKRFHKIETFNPRCHAHHPRVDSEKELTREVTRWLNEAYAVGQQKHLG